MFLYAATLRRTWRKQRCCVEVDHKQRLAPDSVTTAKIEVNPGLQWLRSQPDRGYNQMESR